MRRPWRWRGRGGARERGANGSGRRVRRDAKAGPPCSGRAPEEERLRNGAESRELKQRAARRSAHRATRPECARGRDSGRLHDVVRTRTLRLPKWRRQGDGSARLAATREARTARRFNSPLARQWEKRSPTSELPGAQRCEGQAFALWTRARGREPTQLRRRIELVRGTENSNRARLGGWLVVPHTKCSRGRGRNSTTCRRKQVDGSEVSGVGDGSAGRACRRKRERTSLPVRRRSPCNSRMICSFSPRATARRRS